MLKPGRVSTKERILQPWRIGAFQLFRMNNAAIHCQKRCTYDHSVFMALQEVNTNQGFFRPDANVQHGRADYGRDSIIASVLP